MKKITRALGILLLTALSFSCTDFFDTQKYNKYDKDGNLVGKVKYLGDVIVSTSIGSGAFKDASTTPLIIEKYIINSTETTYGEWIEVLEWAKDNGYYIAQEGTSGRQEDKTNFDLPVTNVSVRDIRVWCNAASEKAGLEPVYYKSHTKEFVSENVLRNTGGKSTTTIGDTIADLPVIDPDANGYRLPTRVEWEFAARGGNPDSEEWNYKYSGSNTASDVAWTGTANEEDKVSETVGKKKPNKLGLYDMSGNVWEYVESEGKTWYLCGGSRYRPETLATVDHYSTKTSYYTYGDVGFRWAKSVITKSGTSANEKIPENFKKTIATKITGTEFWKPESEVFISGRQLRIPTLLVCDHEVTRGEFKEVMGIDPSTFDAYDKDGNKLTGDAVINNPVGNVSWYDAITYCNKLSLKEKLTPCYSVEGITDWANLDYSSLPTERDLKWEAATCNFKANGYRLPTEAEWEWLARGVDDYMFAGGDTLNEVSWSTRDTSNTIKGSIEVKTKKANGFGLYDMTGNVAEWCWDMRSSIAPITTTTPIEGPNSFGKGYGLRVIRGGGNVYDNYRGFVYTLDDDYADKRWYEEVGFRVVRTSSK